MNVVMLLSMLIRCDVAIHSHALRVTGGDATKRNKEQQQQEENGSEYICQCGCYVMLSTNCYLFVIYL